MGDFVPNKSAGAFCFWFHFSVSGVPKGSNLTFTFRNLGNQVRFLEKDTA